MSTLEQRYQAVSTHISSVCEQAHRSDDTVKLLAVSKTKPAHMVETLYQFGQRAFGENYLQDAVEKITTLAHLKDIEWHFIGPIQSNKTRVIAEHFQWVETLDREKIAQRLNDQRSPALPALNVLIQVNISREDQKSGISPEHVESFAKFIEKLPNLSLQGLMCIPEATKDENVLAAQFDEMQQLLQQLANNHPQCTVLSMGMSSDLALAVQHGSSQVRIGTDIFGSRD
ncbi:MAG: YggS family pyridoxal phosphate-dependent enzyme [Oleispira antarctica]|uniref:Pyridoxal phosphate homeostasis protein n=1 Tax=Oleispira antarctica RB-8 TaxID=698738 RepID=R4YQ30_OLEAN|nr:YggS family pyridoxal phosphate-dependent enzyme [Oleispira antarctica]MBQ0793413.1 YggS family pyridoxal phosphate-dependent enzyme [Oleispira antarctica]CCK74254.1 Alanine racemase domain protein [Oleispira antarctica RB-8]|tara:strand:+ start:794 stop:1480 length:687 start_codon:yes stop_codon:yes gene_type:complete